MLEDELREMFGARVRTPPAALDPAGTAITRGRIGARRRRAIIGVAAVVAFAAMLGGAATLKGMWTPVPGLSPALTYEGLFGPDVEQPSRAGVDLPIVNLPIDVHVGTDLWTADGRRLTLSGVDNVIEVVRVPAGWLYSDDVKLRLLTLAGKSMPVRENISTWAVSVDGTRVATLAEGTILEVRRPGVDGVSSAYVPTGARPVGFDGTKVVLQSEVSGLDYWDSSGAAYQAKWNNRLLTVYGSTKGSVGLVEEKEGVCLVDLLATKQGWQLGPKLGCADLLKAADEAELSPDGRWLAVPSPNGVRMIDINASRIAGGSEPIVAQTCESAPGAPAVWADAETLLTISSSQGIIACGTNGSRSAVPLPSGVSTGWALVPRYGVVG